MTTIRLNQRGIEQIQKMPGVADLLHRTARLVAARVRKPRKMRLSTRRGVGRRGAFAQVVLRGAGALSVEFGNRNMRPLAPLRSALRRAR